jgi:hypothetical protein
MSLLKQSQICQILSLPSRLSHPYLMLIQIIQNILWEIIRRHIFNRSLPKEKVLDQRIGH